MKKSNLKIGEAASTNLSLEVKNIDKENYTLTMVASTQTKDSHGDIMIIEGVDLKRYKKNPVILNSHKQNDLTEIIGRATKTWIEGKGKKAKLMQDWEFAVEQNPKAEIAFALFAGGFAKASSIGFIPKEIDYDEKENAFLITEWELLEVSGVAVPANSLSLASKSLGVSESEIKDTFVKFSEGEPVTTEDDETEPSDKDSDKETEEVAEETETEEPEAEEVVEEETPAEEEEVEEPEEKEEKFHDVSKTPKKRSYKAKAVAALNLIKAKEDRDLRVARKAIDLALGVDTRAVDKKTQKQIRKRAINKATRILIESK